MRLCGQEFTPELIARIEATAHEEPTMSRRALSRRLCQWLHWRGPTGRLKEMSARVAMRRLESAGRLTLPAPVHRVPGSQGAAPGPSRRAALVPESPALSMSLRALGAVELVLVGAPRSRQGQVWRALMQRHHPLGAGPLCGAQLRYLIASPTHGWLGALAFSSAAWRVGARDEYIGWSEAARAEHLAEVVCNSRFVILPGVRVAHLASHVLGQATRRLRADWAARYGHQPVLVESYVERERHRGTCYRAANWQRVGHTAGRGRQDRTRQARLPVKDLYLYPLVRHWRQRLCREAPVAPRRVSDGDWAVEEFSRAGLGDARLEARVLTVARDLYARPQAQLPGACASAAKTKAAYRLFDHQRVTREALLASHYEASAARVAEHPVVLAVQDSSSLNYTAHPLTEGLGPLNTSTDHSLGLWMHDTMAFTPEGTPLGLLDVQCWAREPSAQGKRHTRYQRPIEAKESAKWLHSFEALCQLQRRCPATTLISVGDREADVYELLVRAQRPGAAKLLIRAERTRRMVREHGPLWEHMASAEVAVAGTQVLEVPRRHNRPRRNATLEIRFAEVELQAPKRKTHLGSVRLWAVWAHEPEPPEGIVALDWMVLTTVPVHTFDDALERLAWYRQRWGIEVYHRTLKSGCRIEERQLGSAERLETCLAFDLVVAWRIYHLARLGRETPEVPCTVYFEDAEWKALVTLVHRDRTAPERGEPSLGEAMRMVAGLGGYLGRNSDGPPGTKSLWLGLQVLEPATAMWLFMSDPSLGGQLAVSSKHDYG